MSGKRNSYIVNFKLQGTAFIENTNNSMAARRFSANKKLVRDWRKKQNDLSEMLKSKKATCDCRLIFPKLEERLN